MRTSQRALLTAAAIAAALLPLAGPGPTCWSAETSDPDSGMVLEGGASGTALRSLTVEGEDRIQFEFERPSLRIDFDASRVAGLELGSALAVLNRSEPELVPVMLASSAGISSPYLGRPWLSNFATGALARFQPQLEDVDRWTLSVADSRGETVASFNGRGNPPDEIAWDGRTLSGGSAVPGLTYSYVLEAFDRAGNKRNFVGNGFQVPAYRVGAPDEAVLVMSATDLTYTETPVWTPGQTSVAGSPAPPILVEAASWLNQGTVASTPIRLTVMARSYDQAVTLADRVAEWMRSETTGDPALVQVATDVRPDAPAEAAIQVSRAAGNAAQRAKKTN